jgi:hypothetical protein
MARREDAGNDDESDASERDHAQADWIPEAAITRLVLERATHDEETEEQLSRRLMREAAPQITVGIIHTAIHGATDRVRLDAQKYVLERVLGKVGDESLESNKTPLELLAEALVANAEEFANAAVGDQDK